MGRKIFKSVVLSIFVLGITVSMASIAKAKALTITDANEKVGDTYYITQGKTYTFGGIKFKDYNTKKKLSKHFRRNRLYDCKINKKKKKITFVYNKKGKHTIKSKGYRKIKVYVIPKSYDLIGKLVVDDEYKITENENTTKNTYKLNVKFDKENVYKKLIYTSSNPEILKVDSEGDFTVKKKINTEVNINIKTLDGSKLSKNIKVKMRYLVPAKDEEIKVELNSIEKSSDGAVVITATVTNNSKDIIKIYQGMYNNIIDKWVNDGWVKMKDVSNYPTCMDMPTPTRPTYWLPYEPQKSCTIVEHIYASELLGMLDGSYRMNIAYENSDGKIMYKHVPFEYEMGYTLENPANIDNTIVREANDEIHLFEAENKSSQPIYINTAIGNMYLEENGEWKLYNSTLIYPDYPGYISWMPLMPNQAKLIRSDLIYSMDSDFYEKVKNNPEVKIKLEIPVYSSFIFAEPDYYLTYEGTMKEYDLRNMFK